MRESGYYPKMCDECWSHRGCWSLNGKIVCDVCRLTHLTGVSVKRKYYVDDDPDLYEKLDNLKIGEVIKINSWKEYKFTQIFFKNNDWGLRREKLDKGFNITRVPQKDKRYV
tara:strand:+ start:231 stop:566 length:336 start_codon:yes stop_codon:yes gene_type:complete